MEEWGDVVVDVGIDVVLIFVFLAYKLVRRILRLGVPTCYVGVS